MTPLPKRRNSTARSSQRQRARFLNLVVLTKCPNCGQPTRPHTVCPNCGFYDQSIVLPPKVKKTKTE